MQSWYLVRIFFFYSKEILSNVRGFVGGRGVDVVCVYLHYLY